MIYVEKDPTLKTLLVQEALKARGLYTGELDNWEGPRTEDALEAFHAEMKPSAAGPLPNLHRDISSEGIDLIRHFEGLYLNAYQDSVGVWTIGWGHTGLKHKDGTVFKGRTISKQEAFDLFRYDMDFFEGRVSRYVKIALNDDEFAALVSFDFNTGGLPDSTLLRLLNAGDRQGAADQFLRWDKAGGKVLAGLTRRRKSERNLFLGMRPFIVPI
jgi:lysozyme